MTIYQQEQYKSLLSELREVMPIIQQLDLTRPRVMLKKFTMATKIITSERMDRALLVAFRTLEVLEDNAKRWRDMPDSEQIDWSWEWDRFLKYLDKVLVAADDSKQMSVEQQAQYKSFLSKLREVMPIIQKLNLTRPRIALEV